jgi:hypothetical protein
MPNNDPSSIDNTDVIADQTWGKEEQVRAKRMRDSAGLDCAQLVTFMGFLIPFIWGYKANTGSLIHYVYAIPRTDPVTQKKRSKFVIKLGA